MTNEQSESQLSAPEARPVWGAPIAVRDRPFDGTPPADFGTDQSAGPPPGGKRMSTMAKSLTAIGVAAVVAVGGTVAISSASGSSGTQQGQGGGGQGAPGGGGFGGANGQAGAGGFGNRGGAGAAAMSDVASALHGQFVVPATGSGTATTTEQLQVGAITAVSTTSVSLKSTDGFVGTYQVGTGTDVSSFAIGDTVRVLATVSGSTLTLKSIAGDSGQNG